MPIYEYQCDDCNHVLDALQKVSDKPLVDCPECGKTSLRRLISAPNFRLKGEGWYETDFKKENRKNVADQKDEKPEKKSEKERPAEEEKTNRSKDDSKESVQSTNKHKPTEEPTDSEEESTEDKPTEEPTDSEEDKEEK